MCLSLLVSLCSVQVTMEKDKPLSNLSDFDPQQVQKPTGWIDNPGRGGGDAHLQKQEHIYTKSWEMETRSKPYLCALQNIWPRSLTFHHPPPLGSVTIKNTGASGTASHHKRLQCGTTSGCSDPPYQGCFGYYRLQLTCVERQRVDEGAGDLLRRSLVPQREVISVEHPLLVLRRQEVS